MPKPKRPSRFRLDPAVRPTDYNLRLEPDLDVLRREGAVVVLAAGDDAEPLEVEQPSGDTLLIQVPDDIVGLRERDPVRARAWRLALRGALGGALADGYVARSMSRSGWYVLSRKGR